MRMLTTCAIAIGILGGIALNAEQQGKAESVDVCSLQADPPTYNHKLIEVTGLVSHGFEHFSISDAKCSPSNIWLDYGGTVNSETVFCCGTTAGAARGKTLVVEGLTLPLVADALFRRFDERIRQAGAYKDVKLRATLRGRFFAGEKWRFPDGREAWGGYGHIGCCSLLVIQQVLAVDAGADPHNVGLASGIASSVAAGLR